ncbi:MAG: S-adenosyl-L-methionine-dependent methyltransferase [Piptocephalis tieghemiana]|nr:MAG: S-adenosyl-L-methionine-dependent methyltransferase [Piptocephalis tieghemiana]
MEFIWEGNRRFLNPSTYILPHDPTEMHRSDLMHKLLFESCGAHYLAPLDMFPRRILDVGCGTGQWVRDVGHSFPDSQVYGMDMISDGFRMEFGTPAWPPNATLCLGDVIRGLAFPDNSFDFIHQRYLWSIPSESWPWVLQELFRMVQPGGWCEVGEGDARILLNFASSTSACHVLSKWTQSLFSLRGIDMDDATRIGGWMRQVGFVNVQRRDIRLPMGRWAGSVGEAVWGAHRALLEGCRAWEKALGAAPIHTLSEEMWNGWLGLFDQEMATEKDIGLRTIIFFGRKPHEGEGS